MIGILYHTYAFCLPPFASFLDLSDKIFLDSILIFCHNYVTLKDNNIENVLMNNLVRKRQLTERKRC